MLVADYDLELERVVEEIKKSKAKRVLLQLPDGVKPKAEEIVSYIEGRVPDADLLVWAGSCFGACDIPMEAKNIGVDLLIHWGHSRWKF